jgi:2-keto-4-pentenoate hydratase
MAPIDELARRLYDAERTAVAVAPLTAEHPDLSIADAYAVQLAGRALRVADGAALVGRKVGLTSRPMQEMMGVDQPDLGYLTDAMVSPDGATMPAHLIAPRVEAEIAFRLKAPLAGPDLTIADVLAATEAVAPAIEVIDSRIADWRIQIADTIADNASSGHVAIGAWQPLGDRDLAAMEMTLTVDPGESNAGRGDAVLGHPAAAVVWLARSLHAFGAEPLAAGEIVIPGAMSRALPVAPGGSATATFDGLGSVTARFAAEGS